MATIKDMFVMMSIGVVGFGIIMLFVTQMAVDNGAGGSIDSRLNDTYNKIQAQNDEFVIVQEKLQNLSNAAEEATFGDFAYFGIRGMVAIMKAPFSLVTVVISSVEGLSDLFSAYIPVILIKAVAYIIGIIMLFAGIKFLTSRGQEP